MSNYKTYFGFTKDVFDNNVEPSQLLKLPGMIAVKERIDYIFPIGGILVITGEVGSGKSTALRWATSQFHPSQYKIANIIGTSGALIDFYRQLCWALEIDIFKNSRGYILRSFKNAVYDIVKNKKQKLLLVIDEASLLRSEVFSELHILSQYDNDSKNFLSIVLAGQVGLIDKLMARSAAPLASRVVSKTHLMAISRDQMEEYLNHHLKIAGVKNKLFSESAITAIQQGSGGLLRKANSLARGSLVAASTDKTETVSAEHVRIASTELF